MRPILHSLFSVCVLNIYSICAYPICSNYPLVRGPVSTVRGSHTSAVAIIGNASYSDLEVHLSEGSPWILYPFYGAETNRFCFLSYPISPYSLPPGSNVCRL